MNRKFLCTILFGIVWLLVSTVLAVCWAEDLAHFLPAVYVWLVILGIALIPGFLMSTMFFSNFLHRNVISYPSTEEDVTILMCAYNEEANIEQAIACICRQVYSGRIRLLVIDNCSTDDTKATILQSCCLSRPDREVAYVYCDVPGKANALNFGLRLVDTPHFITVDADTFLEQHAVQRIMNHIVARASTCVAGNLFVRNAKKSIFTKMQIYDYLLSIAAIKRFQGSYRSTLVAQGAFSAYQTEAVQTIGG